MSQKTAAINLSNSDDSQEWATPKPLFEWICKTFDLILLVDACASSTNYKCGWWYDKTQDGLKQKWVYDTWINPPYRDVSLWIKKAYEEHLKNNITVVALIFSKTDTKFWHDYIENKAEVHFIKGRIKFVKPDGTQSKQSAPYPSCVVIWRKKN